ncbi:hypothetical protein PFY12_00505 [Chryseobacterium camelliae]|uniref:Uncharacterized protein n=1 Tax=Chryseobacterium camelliae TaxID=1265445 RepID=A0ABY7QLS0_9FLAO|nr:hypothetical protein [Chryseobacterium camelliae]WBV60615.1 hypothetical protein PFY12_00505 [Chryseobacterium camelliae]
MTEYKVKSSNSLVFELTKNEIIIGNLTYKSWFKFSAEFDLSNSKYQIEPKGFWGTTIELKEGEKILLKFRMNWNGDIVIQTYFNETKVGYIFKHRGIFKESFVLTDEAGTELLVMKPDLKWYSMNYGYQITTSDTFDTFIGKDILLMTSLHCANYYMSMMMAGM